MRAKHWSVGCHSELPAPGKVSGTGGGTLVGDQKYYRERIDDITLLHLSQKPIAFYSGFSVLLM